MSRGKRYDGEQKLNIKKVFAVLIAILVIIMFVLGIQKLFDKEGRCCGTIATHNKNFILNPLNEYDCGLMKTGAGVYYRDKDLNLTAAEILEEYAIRKKELNLESSSHYNKFHKREKVNAKI